MWSMDCARIWNFLLHHITKHIVQRVLAVGLGNVAIGSKSQTFRDIFGFAFHREHYYRQKREGRMLAQRGQYLEAISVRQPDIQKYRVRSTLLQTPEERLDAIGGLYGVSRSSQAENGKCELIRVIFDNEGQSVLWLLSARRPVRDAIVSNIDT